MADKSIAISVEGVSKTFKIPHEKISTLRGAFVGALRNRGYEKFKALDKVSFEVRKGEFFGIIGRNGSGKSTLLKIIAGIYTPDKGEIKINGLISPFLELGIGFNPELSGRDNIYLNASVLGLTKKQIDKRFDDIVAFSELKRFIDQKVKNYSSGMSVRLAFSVAIHANRNILLMDEVLAVGDTNFQSKCFEEFNKYRDMGRTVILVTHDIGIVQRYCDRAMLLRKGKIEMIGDPEKVGNKYIYQNMSDEERRSANEEKRQRIQAEKEADHLANKQKVKKKHQKEGGQQEEKRERIAKITKVEFLDSLGKKRNVFKTGEDVTAKVYFKFKDKKIMFNFGVALFNQDNTYIFGINTILDKCNVNINQYVKQGFLEVKYPKIPLKMGAYFIKVAIFGKTDSKSYDFLDRSNTFKVFSNTTNQGITGLNYEWK